jgi:hypothetical protein
VQPGRVALGVSRDARHSAGLCLLFKPAATPLVEPAEPLDLQVVYVRWSSLSRPRSHPLVEPVETSFAVVSERHWQ